MSFLIFLSAIKACCSDLASHDSDLFCNCGSQFWEDLEVSSKLTEVSGSNASVAVSSSRCIVSSSSIVSCSGCIISSSSISLLFRLDSTNVTLNCTLSERLCAPMTVSMFVSVVWHCTTSTFGDEGFVLVSLSSLVELTLPAGKTV